MDGRRLRLPPRLFLTGFSSGILAGVILAGAAVALRGGTGDAGDPAYPIYTFIEETVEAEATVSVTPGPRTLAPLDVRIGPGDTYAIVGVLARSQELELVGRSADSTWLAISFPPGSSLTGWLPAAQVRNVPELSTLAVRQATVTPRFFQPSGPGLTPNVIATPATTPAPAKPLPDLVVVAVTLLNDGRVSVTVRNVGGDSEDAIIFLRVNDLSSAGETLTAQLTKLSAGGSVTLTSDLSVRLRAAWCGPRSTRSRACGKRTRATTAWK